MTRRSRGFTRGFTLVELLVVISIISILSVIGITVFNGAREKAKTAATLATINAVYKQIERRRVEEQNSLLGVLGPDHNGYSHGCTECTVCRGPGFDPSRTGDAHYVGQDYSNVKSTACLNSVTDVFVNHLGMSQVPKDGWGDYILLDANEGEGGNNRDCRSDILHSVHGPIFRVPLGVLPLGDIPCNPGTYGG